MKEIPYDRLPRGIKLCIHNANRLLQDAKLLRDNKKFSSALVCAIFAYEELGKAISLRDKWIKKENLTLKDWKQMLDHVKKSYHTNKFMQKKSGRQFDSDDNDFRRQLQKIEDDMLTFDATERSIFEKESNLYVNWTKAGWISPNDLDKIDGIANRRILEVSSAIEHFLDEEQTQEILSAPESEWIDKKKIELELMMLLFSFDRYDNSIKVETVVESDRITKIILTNSGRRLSGQEKQLIVSHFKEYQTMKKTKFFFIEHQS
ncbi:hypothetical protein Ngar_c27730 [Candidatus Nitrososphaera gargensis Ga9.2]|uniref:AbiV family abortive infection protein n=1 Tax=Nitrososphaera gargensis (strain Ga9.2) TaxID=1237085 RepID=K0INN7_NITGG|nr:AbiV family abortive infection protein [Candidatus Nitrososphaera gargensis]AFU59694.1 hypothetical protein Ngar_c27730 [Candidatus Nitrososphaera gargensis Ga9.2]